MTKTEKKKWVAALRSGKYNQTTGYLKNEDGFCCLGVAREIGLCDKLKGCENVSFSFLPENKQDILVNFNDDKGKSFKWIAYYIERYL